MTERDNRSEGSRRISNLEKAGRLAIATTVLAGCAPGEKAPSVDQVNDTNRRVEESQEASSVDENIRITQEAFTGSGIEGTQVVELESTQSLGLGVEKTSAIVEEITKKGLDPEETTYGGFYKVDEAGNKELVLILSTPSATEQGNSLFYVTGKDKGNFVPVGLSSQVELLEMREYEIAEGEKEGSTVFGFQTEEGDLIPVIEVTENVSYYIDPYTKGMTRMSDELSSEVLAMMGGEVEGAQELIDRLGDGAEVVDGNLVYNGVVIGELNGEKQVSFQVEEETVSISTENLEVKDGVLVSVNRERTEEMGVDWVEQAWVEGERVEVKEPVVGLPETYEETLVVQEKSLDYFMPKLLAAEKKWLEENGGLGENQNRGGFYFPRPELKIDVPYVERWVSLPKEINNNDLVFSSWTRVEMSSGKILELVSTPFEDTSLGLDKYFIWHFVYDSEASANWAISRGNDSDLSTGKPEFVFDGFRDGSRQFQARTFIDSREVKEWQEEYGWTESVVQELIERGGFEDIDVLMKRMLENVPNHGEAFGTQMIEDSTRDFELPERFMESMELQLIPSLVVYGEY